MHRDHQKQQGLQLQQKLGQQLAQQKQQLALLRLQVLWWMLQQVLGLVCDTHASSAADGTSRCCCNT